MDVRGEVLEERYDIERPLGRGAAGERYLARDRLINRRVVLELNRGVQLGREDEARDFLWASLYLTTLDHPNLLKVHDAGGSNHGPYLSSEYVEEPTLETVLAEGQRLPPERVADIGRQVLEGLAEAQPSGVVYAALPSQDVILYPDGRVRVRLGLAATTSLLGKREDREPKGTGCGAPEYGPPMWAGDVYTVGSLLTLALGIDPGGLNSPFGGALEPLLAKAVSTRPEWRYRNAEQFQAALLDFLAGNGIAAGRVAAGVAVSGEDVTAHDIRCRRSRLRAWALKAWKAPWASRRRIGVSLASVVLVLGVGIATLSIGPGGQMPETPAALYKSAGGAALTEPEAADQPPSVLTTTSGHPPASSVQSAPASSPAKGTTTATVLGMPSIWGALAEIGRPTTTGAMPFVSLPTGLDPPWPSTGPATTPSPVTMPPPATTTQTSAPRLTTTPATTPPASPVPTTTSPLSVAPTPTTAVTVPPLTTTTSESTTTTDPGTGEQPPVTNKGKGKGTSSTTTG